MNDSLEREKKKNPTRWYDRHLSLYLRTKFLVSKQIKTISWDPIISFGSLQMVVFSGLSLFSSWRGFKSKTDDWSGHSWGTSISLFHIFMSNRNIYSIMLRCFPSRNRLIAVFPQLKTHQCFRDFKVSHTFFTYNTLASATLSISTSVHAAGNLAIMQRKILRCALELWN